MLRVSDAGRAVDSTTRACPTRAAPVARSRPGPENGDGVREGGCTRAARRPGWGVESLGSLRNLDNWSRPPVSSHLAGLSPERTPVRDARRSEVGGRGLPLPLSPRDLDGQASFVRCQSPCTVTASVYPSLTVHKRPDLSVVFDPFPSGFGS